jgi:hypothetical protein
MKVPMRTTLRSPARRAARHGSIYGCLLWFVAVGCFVTVNTDALKMQNYPDATAGLPSVFAPLPPFLIADYQRVYAVVRSLALRPYIIEKTVVLVQELVVRDPSSTLSAVNSFLTPVRYEFL